jgi:hypothetical protein
MFLMNAALCVCLYASFAKESLVFVIRTLSMAVCDRLCLGSGGLIGIFFTVSVFSELYANNSGFL